MAEPGTRTPTEGQNQELASFIEEWSSKPFDLLQLPYLINDVKSGDVHSQYHGIIGIKKLLGQESPPIQEILDSGIVPRFIEFLENNKEITLQVIIAGIFPNLVCGTTKQIKTFIDLGGLSILLKVLQSPNPDLYKEAVFALGNIAADSIKYRNMLLNHGALEHIVKILATTEDHSLIKDATWTLSNLCREKPAPKLSKISAAIPVLCGVIKMDTYPEATLDAVVALTSICEADPADNKIQDVIATGVVPSFIKHLKSEDEVTLAHCLRVIGIIITGENEQAEFVISFPDFLPQVFQLAQHEKETIRRDACWIVSNITAGNIDQVSLVINNLQYVQTLIKIALTDNIEVKREATWALTNATAYSDPSYIPQIIKVQIFDCLVDTLDNNDDAQLLQVALEGIDNILSKWGNKEDTQGGEPNEFVTRLMDKGGLDKLESLQSHHDTGIYAASLKILQKHFELEELPMDNNVVSQYTNLENQFNF